MQMITIGDDFDLRDLDAVMKSFEVWNNSVESAYTESKGDGKEPIRYENVIDRLESFITKIRK